MSTPQAGLRLGKEPSWLNSTATSSSSSLALASLSSDLIVWHGKEDSTQLYVYCKSSSLSSPFLTMSLDSPPSYNVINDNQTRSKFIKKEYETDDDDDIGKVGRVGAWWDKPTNTRWSGRSQLQKGACSTFAPFCLIKDAFKKIILSPNIPGLYFLHKSATSSSSLHTNHKMFRTPK